jgi:hypothetical protein
VQYNAGVINVEAEATVTVTVDSAIIEYGVPVRTSGGLYDAAAGRRCESCVLKWV